MTRPTRPYRLRQVNQTYHIGEDGLPTHLITQATVVALEPVTALEYVFDTEHADVQGVSGCHANPVRPDHYDERYRAVDLTLDTPLAPGGEVTVEYHTFFSYPSPPAFELQQGSGSHGADRVELTVRFASGVPPQHVWWERRDGLEDDSPVIGTHRADIALTDLDDPGAGFAASQAWTDLPPKQLVGIYWENW